MASAGANKEEDGVTYISTTSLRPVTSLLANVILPVGPCIVSLRSFVNPF